MSTSPGHCTNCGISHPLNYVILDGKCLCAGCWHKMFPYCKSCGERLTLDMNITYFKDKKGLLLPIAHDAQKIQFVVVVGYRSELDTRKLSMAISSALNVFLLKRKI